MFCEMVEGRVPVEVVGESEQFLAFLGIQPRYPGMTVVITKRHAESYLYQSLTDEEIAGIHRFAKEMALKLDRSLGSFRCIQVMEGFDVNHAHIKLFPVYEGKMYEGKYEGDERVSPETLRPVAEKIRKCE